MWSSRVLLVITIAVVALQQHPSCAQSPVVNFMQGFASALSPSIFPRNYTDVPEEFGREVSIVEVPYQIALYKDNYFICGGAIISADWVLTAADCVYGGGKFGVRAGSSSNAKGGQIRHVTAIVINGGYNSISKENNIAMIRVAFPFSWSRFVQPVAITGQLTKVPENLLVTGWGSSSDIASEPVYQLRGVEVTHEACRHAFLTTASVSKNVLCATVSVRDACQGDSGSPLAYQGTLYGIQSFGAGCVRSDMPGIYTNVRRQTRWIKTVAKRFGGKIHT